MAGRSAHPAKVTRSIHNSLTEMIMPDTVDNTSPSQWVTAVNKPLGKRCTSLAFLGHVPTLEVIAELWEHR